ncbi:hypothetical protein QL995_21320 [Pseudoalteromonas sp. APC 3358]|nr:hypothetical protein [Pseudoalteromonas sp. APC 3358]MDN3385165.1 hypothetical protein [Pseudoalteromonas sp. APC 3358]
MRQLGEVIDQNIATRIGVESGKNLKQIDLLRALDYHLKLDNNIQKQHHTAKARLNKKGELMAREKKLIVGTINVTIKNHTPERYVELFNDVYKLKRTTKIAGDQYGLLAKLSELHKNKN